MKQKITTTLYRFLESESAGGIAIVLSAIFALLLANSAAGPFYESFIHYKLSGLSVEHWVNDGLMAIFFLLIGLELKREILIGELSDIRKAALPLVAALGGVIVPAFIHFALNAGSYTQRGMGIPMATDIAFALGILSLAGNRVPASLKVFLTALAVIDDLFAIIVIAVFYTDNLVPLFLMGAVAIFIALLALNFVFRVKNIFPYIGLGLILWWMMLNSGIHATIAGVLLALTIPFSDSEAEENSPSHKLENYLHQPVAFIIVPIFALINSGVVIGCDAIGSLSQPNSLGIALGLILGKPIGIFTATFAFVRLKLGMLADEVTFKHILGAGMMGGIGFTMSIFITNLAFPGDADLINSSKMSILAGSLISAIAGYSWLVFIGRSQNN